ncbi:hypothetical protein L6E12_32175 [Actinokineospora sp. PR83]|uniref:hypothetical protein n=1 Tax=Actinokineospora sp. PR83 TaxID=2884908 RepID=UPI001F394C83|nr:hypothetical protein [Actinokineospora sp. PR83]MCG8920435.1 hypothetical protein [Actinokineospora sp. PR83]
MDRWERARGRTGVQTPSWLTFELYRPYLDGSDSPLAPVHARSALLAARLFQARAPLAPRFGMNMPASFRTLLHRESGLREHRATDPTDLPEPLAGADWRKLTTAFVRKDELDSVDRVGLAYWLIAVCLHSSVLDVVGADLADNECADPVLANLQLARATALFAVEGLGERTRAAYARLVDHPLPTPAHAQALAAYGYLLARHADSDADAPLHLGRAADLLKRMVTDLSAFDHTLLTARLRLRESLHAERAHDLARAAGVLADAAALTAALTPESPEESLLALEMRRRVLDRRADIAAKSGDRAAEDAVLAEALALDPTDIKVRVQLAQAAERDGDDETALAGWLHAARLGPYGTAFALLGAVGAARRLGHEEFARVLAERAFRAAPRSTRTRDVLLGLCADDEPMAEVVRRAAAPDPGRPHTGNWHYRMHAAYFDLGQSLSPGLYADLPTLAHGFAERGTPPEPHWQRLMPPAFRANLVRESGLDEFAVDHPAQLPAHLRTPAWDQLCAWVEEFPEADAERRYLTATVLFRLGFGKVVLDLLPPTPVADLGAEPAELRLRHWRDVVAYVGGVGTAVVTPTASFEIAGHPACPTHLRFVIAVFAVVFHARETRSLDEARSWRDTAEAALAELLADDGYSEFEKKMMESRFYRSVTYVPFLSGDHDRLTREMDRAEELARALVPTTPYEEFLARENLRACLESRSKEAFALGDTALGARRVAEVLAIDPYEPKTHMEVAETILMGADPDTYAAAESYLRTARLGPIATARGYALAGECFERADQPALAEDCYLQALRVDPYAITAARGWRRVGGACGMGELADEYATTLEAWGAGRQTRRP